MSNAGCDRPRAKSKSANEGAGRRCFAVSVADRKQQRVTRRVGLEHSARRRDRGDHFAGDKLPIARFDHAHTRRSQRIRVLNHELLGTKLRITKVIGCRSGDIWLERLAIPRDHAPGDPSLAHPKVSEVFNNDKVGAVASTQKPGRQSVMLDRIHARRAQHGEEIKPMSDAAGDDAIDVSTQQIIRMRIVG